MGYGSNFTAILDALITTIVATTTFTSANTSGAYLKSWQGVDYPICIVRPRNDNAVTVHINEVHAERRAVFRVEVRAKGTGTQDNLDTIIGYVGEIVDQIEGNRNLGVTTGMFVDVENINVDYSISPAESAIFYFAILEVRIRYIRPTA